MSTSPVLGAFASTPQQSVAAILALVIALGFLLWFAGNIRRARPEVGSEIELAPNRKPYFNDEQLEGIRLDRVLFYALILISLIAIGLAAYWLAEPGRQAGAVKDFDKTFAKRGAALFARTEDGGFNCAGCHGGVSGGPVKYTLTDPITGKLRQVEWTAPSLDDVTSRMTDDQIRTVLTYGRLFSPMPAWGIEGGGPMNEQQINNLIAYLHSVAVSPKDAKARSVEKADAELALLSDLQGDLVKAQKELADAQAAGKDDDIAAAAIHVKDDQMRIANKQEASIGAALFNVNCARCHTKAWSFREAQAPGSGAMGPPLANVVRQFPKIDDQMAFVSDGKKFGEKYGTQGQASGRMPYFSGLLTPEQIRLIVEYERRLAGETAAQQAEFRATTTTMAPTTTTAKAS
jgi:mono/diheme cytochrome c family protein